MPTVCYVPFCKSGRKKNPIKMKMFSAPKDEKLRKTWEKMIPRKDVLKVTHKVCEVHFEESDIIKGKIFIVNGKEDFFPTKWKLKEGALPRIFPGCPGYLSKQRKVRKPPKDRSYIVVKKKTTSASLNKEKDKETAVEEIFPDCPYVIEPIKDCQPPTKDNQPQAITINNIKDCQPPIKDTQPQAITINNFELVRLPSLAWSWVLIDDPEPLRILMSADKKVVCSESVRSAGKIYSRRSIEFDLLAGTACYFVYDQPLPCVPASLKATFSSENDLTNILKDFNAAKLCPGIPVSKIYGITIPSTLLHENGQVSRSPKCDRIVLNSKQCVHCQRMKCSIRRAEQRKTIKNNKDKITSSNIIDEENQQDSYCSEIIEVNF